MTGTARRILIGVIVAVFVVAAVACGGDDDDGSDEPGGSITMGRADWDTGWFTAEIYRQLLIELGYEVSDPTEHTHTASRLYGYLSDRRVDLIVNGWFPLHEPFLDQRRVSGGNTERPIELVGTVIAEGAYQGYLIDKATADELGITSMSDLADPEVAARFDTTGDGRAELLGCDEGWGCHELIEAHLDELDWGDDVEHVVGDYDELVEIARERIAAGEPVLFTAWTPHWVTTQLVPGEDVVWLESPSLDGDDNTTITVEGCATEAETCDVGWPVNDIRPAANEHFLDDHPPVRRLLEVVEIPLDDVLAQNADMVGADGYSAVDLADDAEAWIAANRETVDGWLAAARG